MQTQLIPSQIKTVRAQEKQPKFLLLTDIPPCSNFTAGLVLDQLCSFMPEESVACFTVLNPHLDPKPTAPHISTKIVGKPKENKTRHLPGQLGALENFSAELYTEHNAVKRIARQAAEFGTKFGADAVWCVIQGQTMIRLAKQVADLMGLPLLTQVWDPPGWWLRANKVDSWSQKRILNEFGNAMSASKRFAAASWSMAERYESQFGCQSIPVIPSLSAALGKEPAERLCKEDELTIGMAGQLYSEREWENLLQTLNNCQWKIAGRQVSIKVLGRNLNLNTNCGMRVEFLGWRDQAETIEILSQLDVLYCPYWFDPNFKEEASLSFPSKLTTYLAAGRPVFFHGPEYASPAKFLKQHNAGILCHDLANSRIYNDLTRLASDPVLYSQCARNGTAAFLQYLTIETMRRNFADFLGVDPDSLISAK